MKALKRLNRSQRIALSIYGSVALAIALYLPLMFYLGWLAGEAPVSGHRYREAAERLRDVPGGIGEFVELLEEAGAEIDRLNPPIAALSGANRLAFMLADDGETIECELYRDDEEDSLGHVVLTKARAIAAIGQLAQALAALGVTREELEDDDQYPPDCTGERGHDWAENEESGRVYCMECGADGDA